MLNNINLSKTFSFLRAFNYEIVALKIELNLFTVTSCMALMEAKVIFPKNAIYHKQKL